MIMMAWLDFADSFNMEKLQLGTAWVAFICTVGMFANAICQSSPAKGVFATLMGILMIASFFLLRMSYKEYKEAKNE